MFWQKETFLFGGLSPPNRKMTSLRPRRLCGEISILDKSAPLYQIFHYSIVPFIIPFFLHSVLFSLSLACYYTIYSKLSTHFIACEKSSSNRSVAFFASPYMAQRLTSLCTLNPFAF